MLEFSINEKNGINDAKIRYLVNNNRVFLQSANINIFPCSRRGRYNSDELAEKTGSYDIQYYDPEARLNTEHTNRLHTALNGFTDKFIVSYSESDKILVFVLAGYYIEVKNFDPLDVANILGNSPSELYVHLSIHTGISLMLDDYTTEILYRQSNQVLAQNYLDVEHTDDTTGLEITDDFFMGVSFTAEKAVDDLAGYTLIPHNLLLFTSIDGNWQLAQTSLLPKIEHGETEDSIKISGDFTIKHDEQTSFQVTQDKTTLGTTEISELDVTGDFTVDGMTNLSATSVQGLIVGEKAEGDIYDNGTIKAKKHIETPTLEATESIKTPVIDVKTLENTQDDTGVKIDDKLTVTNQTTLNAGLTVDSGDTTLKKLSADTLEVTNYNNVEYGLKVANGKTSLRALEATELKVATDALTVTKDTAKFTKPVTVESSLTANSIQINGQGQVPALELVKLTASNTYQLRFKFGADFQIREE